MKEQKLAHDLFIRMAKDSNFGLPYTTIAVMTANIMGVHPLTILGHIGFNNMIALADGTHTHYKNNL